MDRHEFGLDEIVVPYHYDSHWIPDIELTTHFVLCPSSNTRENLFRAFQNVSAIVYANSYDTSPNFSLARLEEETDLVKPLHSARWYVIDVNRPDQIINFLDKIQANSVVIEFQSYGSYHLNVVREKLMDLMRIYGKDAVTQAVNE